MTQEKEEQEKEIDTYDWSKLVEIGLNRYEIYLTESDNEMALNDLESLFVFREKLAILIERTKKWILTEGTA